MIFIINKKGDLLLTPLPTKYSTRSFILLKRFDNSHHFIFIYAGLGWAWAWDPCYTCIFIANKEKYVFDFDTHAIVYFI